MAQTFPDAISACFPCELNFSDQGKRVYVTLGQFSLIRLERDSSFLSPPMTTASPARSARAATRRTPAPSSARCSSPWRNFSLLTLCPSPRAIRRLRAAAPRLDPVALPRAKAPAGRLYSRPAGAVSVCQRAPLYLAQLAAKLHGNVPKLAAISSAASGALLPSKYTVSSRVVTNSQGPVRGSRQRVRLPSSALVY